MTVKFANTTISMGSRHGWPEEGTPEAHVRRHYFWGLNGESHVLGGRGTRQLTINGYINSDTFTNHAQFSAYLDQLHKLIVQKKGDLIVSSPDGSTKTFKDCYLRGIEKVPQAGQKHAVPLPDVVGGTVGPAGGGYWLEVNLVFEQPIQK